MLETMPNRIICSVDMEYKNKHLLGYGLEIKLSRNVDEFDKRITQPVNGMVIDAENIPKGAEVLLNHNATHDLHKLFGYHGISGVAIADNIQYFSIPTQDVYAWRIGNGKWQPLYPYELALRVFKPYEGSITGIKPTLIPNKLYITTGNLKGKVAVTRHHSDYEIIFQNEHGKEERLIRVRHFGETEDFREQIMGIDNIFTEKIINGKLHVGYNQFDAKKINHAD